MWTSLKEYVPAVLRGFLYLILVGVVGGVVGLVLDALPDMEMPLWGWAAVCVLALAAAQFRAFHEVRQHRDASRPDRLRPDWEAHRVYDRIKHHSMWGYQPINPYEGPPIDAIRELHQAVLDEDVTVWGRLMEKPNSPLVRIERDFWMENSFIPKEVMVPPASAGSYWTEPDNPGPQPRLMYRDLKFNKHQVMLRWPGLSLYRRVRRAID